MSEKKPNLEVLFALALDPSRCDRDRHGSGGRMTHDLIQSVFARYFDNPILAKNNDAAFLKAPASSNLAYSTDCHIVSPLFFPGGDIGRLLFVERSMMSPCWGRNPLSNGRLHPGGRISHHGFGKDLRLHAPGS